MSSLPILLVNPRLLLIGGGQVAYRKAQVLIDNQVDFALIAQTFLPVFDMLESKLGLECRAVTEDDLNGFNIIVDATGNPDVAALVLRVKEQRGLLVNIAADPGKSDFFFSAMVNYGLLKVAVSTDGASPTVGQVVRDKIKTLIPPSVNQLLQGINAQRKDGVITPDLSRTQIEQAFDEKGE